MQEVPRRDLPERTFLFAQRVVKLCDHLDRAPGVGRVLARQLLPAGTSVGANVEEAQANRSRADFIATCSVACREARETQYWLRLVAASELVAERRVRALLDEADQLVSILTAIVKTSRSKTKGADLDPP